MGVIEVPFRRGTNAGPHHVAHSSMIAGWPSGGRSMGSPFRTFSVAAEVRKG